jgi:hypothetical protein
MKTKMVVQVALVVVGISYLVTGAWAMLGPRSFFDSLASDFPPYNVHLIHDIGAFTLGLGVTALVALGWRDGWSVALAGNATAALAHLVSHLVDRDEGATLLDPFGLALLAALLVAALVKLRLAGDDLARAAGEPQA